MHRDTVCVNDTTLCRCFLLLPNRERQRDIIAALEAEVTERLAQLRALSAENELLQLRSSVLETAVQGREYQVGLCSSVLLLLLLLW